MQKNFSGVAGALEEVNIQEGSADALSPNAGRNPRGETSR